MTTDRRRFNGPNGSVPISFNNSNINSIKHLNKREDGREFNSVRPICLL